jgi:superfamily II DNA or RNA helicase
MSKLRLRDYQNETIQEIIKNYNNGIQRNLAVLATGMGKTFIATEFHKQFKPKTKTLFLVDRKELAYQAKESFQKSDPTLNVGIEMNVHTAKKADDVVIASVHTIGRKGSYRIGKFKPEQFGKIIVDEAHMSVSDIFVRCLNYLGVGPDNLEDDRILLGLTATPNRTDWIPLGRVYDSMPVKFDLTYGIKNGWLTDLDVLNVESKVDIRGVPHTKNEFDLSELTKAINIERRNQIIVKSYIDTSNGKSAIVYCASVDHAYDLCSMFQENGVTAEVIEANTETTERKEHIKAYKEGKIKVLLNYATLTTGFNAPETSTIILARPIKSDLLIRQIIGRGLRPSEYAFVDMVKTKEQRLKLIDNSIKPTCKIIDIHDIVDENTISSVASLFGFSNELKIPDEQKKFFKQVVEPVNEVVREKGIDVKQITNIEDLHLLVKRKPVSVKSLTPTEEVSDHTNRPWLPTGEDQYEIVYAKEKQSLAIEKNNLDKYELYVVDNKSGLGKKLQEFNDLSGAIKLGDEYADRNFNTVFEDAHHKMKGRGVTKPQSDFLIQLYKGGVRVDRYERYEDTGCPVLYFRKTGERIDSALCSTLIKQRTGR